jgi:hypothetical protein
MGNGRATLDWSYTVKTLEEIIKKYQHFTLRNLHGEFDFNEFAVWEAYFSGKFDEELARAFENSLNPQIRAAASVCYGFTLELRRIAEDIKLSMSNIGQGSK